MPSASESVLLPWKLQDDHPNDIYVLVITSGEDFAQELNMVVSAVTTLAEETAAKAKALGQTSHSIKLHSIKSLSDQAEIDQVGRTRIDCVLLLLNPVHPDYLDQAELEMSRLSSSYHTLKRVEIWLVEDASPDFEYDNGPQIVSMGMVKQMGLFCDRYNEPSVTRILFHDSESLNVSVSILYNRLKHLKVDFLFSQFPSFPVFVSELSQYTAVNLVSMYAAVKRVLREQERQQKVELELERRRLERLVQLHLEASNRRDSSEDLNTVEDGDPIVLHLPFPTELLVQLQKVLADPTPTLSSSDLRLLGHLRPGLFRMSTLPPTQTPIEVAPKRSLTSRIEEHSVLLDVDGVPDVTLEDVKAQPEPVIPRSKSKSRWQSKSLLVTSGVIALVTGVVGLGSISTSYSYGTISRSTFIILAVLSLLIVLLGIGLLVVGGINVSIFPHRHNGSSSGTGIVGGCFGKNSSNAVENLDIDNISRTSPKPKPGP